MLRLIFVVDVVEFEVLIEATEEKKISQWMPMTLHLFRYKQRRC